MDLPFSLRDQIKKLDQSIAEQQQAEEKARAEAATLAAEETRLYESMNFRERRLGGWFGGDSSKVQNYRAARRLKTEFNSQADQHAAQRQELDKQAHRAIHENLEGTDPTYQALHEPLAQAQKAGAAIKSYYRLIESALSDINSAQSMETMDMFSSNKGIAFMSTMSNSTARSAVEQVKAATPAFQSALEAYGNFLKDYELPKPTADFDDMTDLIWDMVLDTGFDFMSYFSLTALNNAEEQMQELADSVKKIGDQIDKNEATARQALVAYRGQVRSLCHHNGPR